MAEVDLLGSQPLEPLERPVVCVAIRRPAATLELVGLARPLVHRVDGLPGQHDKAVVRLNRERLVTRGVTRRGDDPEASERLVVSAERDIGRTREIDPLEDSVVWASSHSAG